MKAQRKIKVTKAIPRRNCPVLPTVFSVDFITYIYFISVPIGMMIVNKRLTVDEVFILLIVLHYWLHLYDIVISRLVCRRSDELEINSFY